MTRARRFLGAAIGLAAWCAIATAAVSAQQEAARRPVDTPHTLQSLGIHGFSVVLVVGSMQGTDSADTVPAAARKALTDMRDFLPYKRYQLMDAAWMLCCAGFTRTTISGRLRGPDQREYAYSIDPIGGSDAKMNLRFAMRDVSATLPGIDAAKMSDTARLEHGRQMADALKERDEAETALDRAQQQHAVGLLNASDRDAARQRSQRAEARVRELRAMTTGGNARSGATRAEAIMDSTFAISPGETVVIGTSRLMGDQALIALLTAATKPGGTR